ncbi:alpha-L-fucosidase [Paenibacillus thailandensis]|uniref:alpha-L-fucosidase n=1 Tax=Paenibacillus thailandensis TaxID=393250 RepID=A0ABW5R0L1_9BACL
MGELERELPGNGHEVEAGVHNYSKESEWVKPDDPLLLERLEWFKDQKLGMMMHWGPYSQLGLVESWALSDADGDWSRHDVDWTDDMDRFKREYFGLNRTFHPIRFMPEQWADIAAQSGFKYLTFTTKHHDGFCMWDTKTTDYKITGADTPFSGHRYADVCRHLFDAFRDKGMAVSAYFSKADWHTPFYWAPGMSEDGLTSRGPSYDTKRYPELWERFVQFTHRQLEELLTDYGRIDILWLDAGWVRADNRKNAQDIRLGELVDRIRKERQPWLLTADRTVGRPYENIVTPEQTVPAKPMAIPWESCMTLGTQFSYKFEDDYKSAREVVHLLLEIVAKGGNLALNVGPQPDGRLPSRAVKRLKEMGEWLARYGEGVYGTRPVAPYFKDGFALTQKDNRVYAFKLLSKNACIGRAETVVDIPYAGEVVLAEWMDGGERLPFERNGGGIRVALPAMEKREEAPFACVFRLTVA